MSACQRCGSVRVLDATAKCSDRFGATLNGVDHDGYVPDDLGIGGGDYMEVKYCLDCGQMQGVFPKPPTEMERNISDEEVLDFYEEHCLNAKLDCIPSQRKNDIIVSAQDLCYRFGEFVNKLFRYNEDNNVRISSAQKFLQMYKNNQWEIE